jgi:hypothetical protein
MIETLITLAIVGAAVVFLVHRLIRVLRGRIECACAAAKPGACSGSCASCPGCRSLEDLMKKPDHE